MILLAALLLIGLVGFAAGVLITYAYTVAQARQDRQSRVRQNLRRLSRDDYFDDSWERFASALRHPSNRIP